MAKLFLATIALCLIGALAKPAKKAEPSPLDELQASAQQIVANVTNAFGIKELPDTKKVVEALNAQTQTLANHVEEIVGKLKAEMKAHQPEVDNVIKSVQKKLAETAVDLQKMVGPETTAKVKDIQANLNSSLKTVVGEVEKLVKVVEPDATKVKTGVQTAAKTFLDQIVDVGNQLQTQFKATLTDHEKTHRH